MTRPTPIALLVAACMLLAPISALSQQAGPHACSVDTQRLCGDIGRGGGQIAQCLEAHRNQLSPGCRDFLSRVQANRGRFSACLRDVRRHCAGIQPGGGRIIACLSEKRDRLAQDCTGALDEAQSLF